MKSAAYIKRNNKKKQTHTHTHPTSSDALNKRQKKKSQIGHIHNSALPRIRNNRPKEEFRPEGSAFHVDCEADGAPPPEVSWIKV